MIAYSLICMSCGNRDGISGVHGPPFEFRCSVLYSIIIILFIFIVMSFGITRTFLAGSEAAIFEKHPPPPSLFAPIVWAGDLHPEAAAEAEF